MNYYSKLLKLFCGSFRVGVPAAPVGRIHWGVTENVIRRCSKPTCKNNDLFKKVVV